MSLPMFTARGYRAVFSCVLAPCLCAAVTPTSPSEPDSSIFNHLSDPTQPYHTRHTPNTLPISPGLVPSLLHRPHMTETIPLIHFRRSDSSDTSPTNSDNAPTGPSDRSFQLFQNFRPGGLCPSLSTPLCQISSQSMIIFIINHLAAQPFGPTLRSDQVFHCPEGHGPVIS